MIINERLPGLSYEIQNDLPGPESSAPSTWPPADDFPVVVDRSGRVMSRYGDTVWNISPWMKRASSINFRDGKVRKGSLVISKENANLFRLLVASWLYSGNSIKSASTLVTRFDQILPLFALCSENGVLASNLSRYPALEAELPKVMRASGAPTIINILHEIWEKRALLGFYILDKTGINRLAQGYPKYQKNQTPYIPPRIWSHQVRRLHTCLQDFSENKQKISDCFKFCLSAYSRSCGSLAMACKVPPSRAKAPFSNSNPNTETLQPHDGANSKFSAIAHQFGIYELFQRWITGVEKSGIAVFSQYLSFVTAVGTAYITAFSLMRINETLSLRSDCLTIEKAPETGELIHIIRGETSKTMKDNDACWIVSPSVSLAVEAMTFISKLRMIPAAANPDIQITDDHISNPYLIVRPYEPWRAKSTNITESLEIRPLHAHYGSYVNRYPKLFSAQELIITEEDLEIALRLTPTLDPGEYAVGKRWPLAWHQLRRTGVVNMLASGLVSDASLQYQLKHVSRIMTRYYGRGYHNIGFSINGEAHSEFIREMYNSVARDFLELQNDRFVSPHGLKRKEQILRLISDKDHNHLVTAAKAGKLAYRPTILGGCTSILPCPFGGIECVVQCAGGDDKPACKDALFDRQKMQKILALKDDATSRIATAPPGSPLKKALQYQLAALENVIDVIS